MSSPISKIDLFSYELTYVNGEYVMSNGRVIRSLSSTVVKITTADQLVGWGESCPLGSNYLPAHAAGARAALSEVAPHLIGLDASNPALVADAMDEHLLGHAYAKSALDIACWDVFGHATGRPVCDLLGGRLHESFPLYVAIPQGSPEEMSSTVARLRDQGFERFQLKLGGSQPAEDAARARAVAEVTGPDSFVSGDANGGWTLSDAIVAARLMTDIAEFFLEQPCATFEECLRVRDHTSLPMILDESIADLAALLRAWEAGALEGVNLKLNRLGGLTRTRLLRDVAASLGLMVNVEDSWGGDLTTAAVSHLAASTDPAALKLVSFMNDWTNEHIGGYEPRSADGVGAAPAGPGLGISIDEERLGQPFASFGA
ncbi:MAG: mandelate racemase/muconate lactonizing enzyme family protein [Solirubrobacterales bacterium]|nr:mandelate racemase/muconate lactonizing enzyme family protein [Solirubrobacterales bacterium]